ncbi:MAG: hypothetical protein HYW88_01860 [Candidatus Sungbacteria bacterium]|nr:hypothetical protein [Candidatus Sungbacteria bacterium]
MGMEKDKFHQMIEQDRIRMAREREFMDAMPKAEREKSLLKSAGYQTEMLMQDLKAGNYDNAYITAEFIGNTLKKKIDMMRDIAEGGRRRYTDEEVFKAFG